MRRQPSVPAQINYFGGLQPQGSIGEEGFKSHAAEKTWDDGGISRDLVPQDLAEFRTQLSDAVDKLAETLIREQATYGAYQARDAVAEYVTQSYLDMAVIDGQACLVLDCSNDSAQFRVWWRLADVIDAAQRAAQASSDRNALSAIDAALRSRLLDAAPAMPGERIKSAISGRVAGEAPRAAPGRTMSRRSP